MHIVQFLFAFSDQTNTNLAFPTKLVGYFHTMNTNSLSLLSTHPASSAQNPDTRAAAQYAQLRPRVPDLFQQLGRLASGMFY